MSLENIKLINYDASHYVVVANAIVKGKQEMTLTEARIIRLLITQVVKEDKDLKTYTCRIQDLADFLGVTGKSIYRDIKTICDNLLRRIVRIETDNPRHPWMSFQWIQLASHDGNGNITLKLSEQIAPYVLELNSWFTQYQLQEILSFNSFYAIRLYEILKCNEGIFKKSKKDQEYEIDYLRRVFDCEKKYKTTAEFIRKVINIGIREINDKSDITAEIEYVKTGRKITSLKFFVSYNIKNKFIRKKEFE